jgi:hypothetical protein
MEGLHSRTIEEFLRTDAGRFDIRGHAIGSMWRILQRMDEELQQYRQLADQLGYVYDIEKKAWVSK